MIPYNIHSFVGSFRWVIHCRAQLHMADEAGGSSSSSSSARPPHQFPRPEALERISRRGYDVESRPPVTLARHKNSVALVMVSHPATQAACTAIDWPSEIVNSKASGKKKKGAAAVKPGTRLCLLRFADGSELAVEMPQVAGKVMEVNNKVVQS